MKTSKKKARKSIYIDGKKIQLYTVEEVFAKVSKTKEFRRAYAEEGVRLKLAQQIRDSRRAKRLTQTAVAERASMPQSVIARLESGEHSISVDTLGKVANALGKQITLIDVSYRKNL